MEEGGAEETGPHMTINYLADKSVFYDVADLLIHHVKRQTSVHNDEKARIKRILRRVLPQLFALEQEVMSDEEDEPSGEGLIPFHNTLNA
jgi:paired amphipathic helix protein Sin3a